MPRSALTRLRLALLVGTFTAASSLTAQATPPAGWRVDGRVVDSTGRGIARGEVSLLDAAGASSRSATDGEGRFSITLAVRGRHALLVAARGFRSTSTSVDVTKSPTVIPDVVLRPTGLQQPVVVIGRGDAGQTRHLSGADVLSAVSILTSEQIARENVDFAQELLRKVSGVYHADFNQGIVSGDIGIRGFNAESEIAHVRLNVDGIPMNINSGFGEVNAIAPLEIDRMEIVRGTSDARYGLFNLAGNVNVATRRGGNSLLTRLTTGSFGTSEAQAVAAIQRGGFSQTYAGSYRTADGFRAHSALDKYTGSAKWFYATPSDRVSVGLIARVHELETDAPGYLTRAESQATPTFSPAFSNADGGDITTRQLSLHADVAPTPTSALSIKAYGQSFDRNRWVRFTAAGAQQERREDENQYGLISQLTLRPAAWRSLDATLSLGADWQTQDNLQQRFRTTDRVRSATLRDYDFTFSNTGAFAQLDLAPIRALRVHGGVRADRFDGEFTNKVANTTLPLLEYGTVWQPKVGAIFAPAAGWSVYGNFGRAFQIGTGIAAFGVAPLAPSVNDGWEVGLSAAPASWLTLRAGFWQQTATDEVRLKFDNSGDSENIGETRREGLDVEGTVQLAGGVSLWGTVTTQRATLVEPGLAQAAIKGNRLNHVPDWTTKLGVDWTHRSGVTAAAWTYGQDDYFLTPANTPPRFGGYFATNVDVSWRLRAATFGVALQNAFDRYFEYAWFDGTQTLHSPANGRSVMLSVTLQR